MAEKEEAPVSAGADERDRYHSTILTAALEYAARGWAVFPLHTLAGSGCTCRNLSCANIGKHPRTEHGFKDATTDPDVIRKWWKRWPNANIGITTGAVSGFIVLDVDSRHGGDISLADLEVEYGPIPATVEAMTGGGGRHILFEHPGTHVSNDNKGKVGPGLDVKGDGGYIVGAPSLHETGRQYAWEVSSRPGDVPLASCPAWLLERLKQKHKAGLSRSPDDWRKLVIDGAEEGRRNDSIASLAGHLLRRGVDAWVALGLIQAWNLARCRPPLGPDEVARTVNSVAGLELRRRGGGQGG